MSQPSSVATAPAKHGRVADSFSASDREYLLARYQYSEEELSIINEENLLPLGVLARLQANYPQHSGLLEKTPFLFSGREQYQGLDGYRKVIAVLEEHGIRIGQQVEREMFVEVYRFLATRHALNSINWSDYTNDSIFQLIFPQPGM
ncbi:MAG TPA: hypothetical protein PKH51_10680, partial [Candidatus Sumerlaeota bacterium]|nr:hypothetical protein [Candidatus Sumerlaeota bacterium]